MSIARLLLLVEQDGSLFVAVRWKGLSVTDDTLELLARVYEDVLQLTLKLLELKSNFADILAKAHVTLGL